MAKAVALCLIALAATIAFGLHEAVAPPIERRVAFHMPGWPAGQRPVTVALLSDIHFGNRAMDA